MRKSRVLSLLGTILLALLLVACDAYTESGAKSRSQQGMDGGVESASVRKANGTSKKEIEIQAGGVSLVDADVTLSVGSGTYTIELLGEDDEATLILEAHSGETVTGHGQMAITFDTACFRVTAEEAENVEYSIVYTFR